MKYYCETIPVTLAEKLKEKGMPFIEIDCETYDSGTEYQRDEKWCNNTYAEVFDWLMDREKNIFIIPSAHNRVWKWTFDSSICELGPWYYTWHEAANAAIEKAITLI